MTVKLECMNCGNIATFVTYNKAKRAGWKIGDAEIGLKKVIVILCPDCRHPTIFNNVVRHMAKST